MHHAVTTNFHATRWLWIAFGNLPQESGVRPADSPAEVGESIEAVEVGEAKLVLAVEDRTRLGVNLLVDSQQTEARNDRVLVIPHMADAGESVTLTHSIQWGELNVVEVENMSIDLIADLWWEVEESQWLRRVLVGVFALAVENAELALSIRRQGLACPSVRQVDRLEGRIEDADGRPGTALRVLQALLRDRVEPPQSVAGRLIPMVRHDDGWFSSVKSAPMSLHSVSGGGSEAVVEVDLRVLGVEL